MKQHNKIRRTWLIFSKQWKRKFPHYSTINFLRPPSAAGLKSTVGANHWADKKLEIMWLAWRLVAGQGLQVSPHDTTLCRGREGGGRSQRNKEMEMENAAAGSRYHYTHWRLCMQLNMRCKIVAKKSEMTKWLANFQLQNSICGLLSSAWESSMEKRAACRNNARAKKRRCPIWTLLGGLSGVVGPGLLPRGGGGYCGYWRGRAGGLWLLTEPRHLVPSSTQTSQH